MTEKTAARVRWGVLGAADIAQRVIPAIRKSRGAVATAIASRSAERSRDWAGRYGIPHAYGSYAELLASGTVDAVYVPLPNSLHADWTVRALDAGLAVLCEKPLAPTLAAAEAIAAASARSGRPVAEGYMYRFHPQWAIVRDLLESGAVGAPSTLDAVFTFRLDEPDSIVASAELAGGALLDVGCYAVHLARWWAGCEPTRVSAFARYEGGVDRTMLGLLEFPNGRLARFETSIADDERHGVAISGTHGTVVLDQPWIPLQGAGTIAVVRDGTPVETLCADVDLGPDTDTYQLQIEHFTKVVAGAEPLRWPLADAVANTAALEALAKSAREGRVVELPPDGAERPSLA